MVRPLFLFSALLAVFFACAEDKPPVEQPEQLGPGPVADAGSDGGVADGGEGLDAGTGTCDPVGQTGCDDPLKCTIVTAPRTLGCAAAGAKGNFETCSSDSECLAGYACAAAAAGETKRCRHFCNFNSDCPQAAAAEMCLVGSPDPLLCDRMTTCDPVGAQTCGTGKGCYLMPLPVCAPAGSRTAGESCAGATECVSGHFCRPAASVGAAGVCRRICDPSGAACVSGSCVALEGSDYGTCQ